MGAESRYDTISGDNLRTAFNRAQDDARYENGSSYTGSIAEARGYQMHTSTPMLHLDATQTAERLLETRVAQKWGPALIIPVAEPTATRTITLTVDLTNDKGSAGWYSSNQPYTTVYNAIRAKLRAGEGVVSVQQESPKTTTKVVATTTKGATKTVYRVKGGNDREQWDYPTLAEAKAAAIKIAEKGWTARYTITKVTLREDNEPLAVVERVVTKRIVTVTAVVGKPSNAAPKQWVACGVYSC